MEKMKMYIETNDIITDYIRNCRRQDVGGFYCKYYSKI